MEQIQVSANKDYESVLDVCNNKGDQSPWAVCIMDLDIAV